MSLDPIRETYEKLGREDPLYAVLTVDKYRHTRWDPEAFFKTGVYESTQVLGYLETLGKDVPKGRALDFGCGVGRLSQALADHFDEVVGVDISSSMLERAREFDRHEGRVRYEHNTRDDLALFPDDSFDFVYSNITLQHVPPDACRRYVRDFFRVLKPGGVTVFQMRGGPPVRPGSLGEKIYLFHRRTLRRLWRRVRGRPPYEMHYIARELMEEHIRDSGGTILDVVHLRGRRRYRKSFRYCAEKSS